MKSKKICVIGLGYIGLPIATLLASKGYQVFGFDTNSKIVEIINSGKVHIAEPDLEKYLKIAISSGNLKAFTYPIECEIYLICVPTPLKEGKDSYPVPDIDNVLKATKSITKILKTGDLVILESTSPVGTTEKLKTILINENIDVDNINIAYCPERVLPGNTMRELVQNDRIVGGLDKKSTQIAADFYKEFVTGNVFETNSKMAEMCKLTENSFRDVNIAFANELSIICESEKIDIWNLIELANNHPRVNILQPSTGVGGHCIAIDPWFIISKHKKRSLLLKTSRKVNNFKTNWVIKKIKIAVADFNAKKGFKPKIVCMGLAFKPNVDDLRGSPAEIVAETLLKQKYDIVAIEPNIKKHPRIKLIKMDFKYMENTIFVFLVKHNEFISKEFIKKISSGTILDFCGVIDRKLKN